MSEKEKKKTTAYSTADTGKLDVKAFNRAIKMLSKPARPPIVEVKFKKLPSEIKKLQLGEQYGIHHFFGMRLIIDKEVPIDECWLIDSKGNKTIIPINKPNYLPLTQPKCQTTLTQRI